MKSGNASEGDAFRLVFFIKLCLNLLTIAWDKGLKSLAWFTLKFGELCVRFERNQKLDCCWIVVEVTDNNEPSTISHCFLSKIVFASSAAAAHLWAMARNGGKGNKSIDRLNYPPSTSLFGAPIKTSYCNCCFFLKWVFAQLDEPAVGGRQSFHGLRSELRFFAQSAGQNYLLHQDHGCNL